MADIYFLLIYVSCVQRGNEHKRETLPKLFTLRSRIFKCDWIILRVKYINAIYVIKNRSSASSRILTYIIYIYVSSICLSSLKNISAISSKVCSKFVFCIEYDNRNNFKLRHQNKNNNSCKKKKKSFDIIFMG